MTLARRAASSALCTLAISLSACAAPNHPQYAPFQTSGVADSTPATQRQPFALPIHRTPHPLTGRSWFLRAAAPQQLLYVSDYDLGVLYTYTFPQGKMVGTIYGLQMPRGMCTDANQNIWVTEAGTSQILQFAHGGTSPIATLNDPANAPVGCAVDPKTGNLAVANINQIDGGPGSIIVYTGATGNGQILSVQNFYNVDFLSYDPSGNLYFDGQNATGAFQLAKLSNGNVTPITVLGPTIYFPGGVQFQNGMLAVGDQKTGTGYTIIYNMTTGGNVQSETALLESTDCVQFTIAGRSVLCPNAGGPNAQAYPWRQGGDPTKTLSGTYDLPIGTAVSK